MVKTYYVYLLASKKHGTLYVGVTSNLEQRMYQHKNTIAEGFTKKYGVKNLVWFDQTFDVYEAFNKEKQIKKWKRQYKINLIETFNPEWRDLSLEFMDSWINQEWQMNI